MYNRTGTCNHCGECCGYPRATDGGQSNPWPLNWPEAVRTWDVASSNQNQLLKFTGNPGLGAPTFGGIKIGGVIYHWIWVTGHGLCTDLPPYGDPASYDERCPMLLAKQGDGTVPCRAYNHNILGQIWAQLCQIFPPLVIDTKEQVDILRASFPSCSYVYIEG